MQIDSHGITNTGRRRKTNEDQFLVASLRRVMVVRKSSLEEDSSSRLTPGAQGELFLVADGIGMSRNGEQASRIAVDSLRYYIQSAVPWFLSLDPRQEDDLIEEMKAVVKKCQRKIREETQQHADRRGTSKTAGSMGTTLTFGYVIWPKLYVIHVGDSRCYLIRNSALQVTTDHTMAQKLVQSGTLPEGLAQKSVWRNVLWNVVGGSSPRLEPEVTKVRLQPGDVLLFCTDGLTKHLRDEEIHMLIQSSPSAKEACGKLVAAANEAGGSDNVTAVVARFTDESRPA
jgi:protein phosphatase